MYSGNKKDNGPFRPLAVVTCQRVHTHTHMQPMREFFLAQSWPLPSLSLRPVYRCEEPISIYQPYIWDDWLRRTAGFKVQINQGKRCPSQEPDSEPGQLLYCVLTNVFITLMGSVWEHQDSCIHVFPRKEFQLTYLFIYSSCEQCTVMIISVQTRPWLDLKCLLMQVKTIIYSVDTFIGRGHDLFGLCTSEIKSVPCCYFEGYFWKNNILGSLQQKVV